ncbi:MAG: hypothetical protein IPO09_07010 [Anaeromyxobacter sp.]|nr:hypothetical protein [Anaeromyxobacter sp.]MBL0277996.1 hypothetical protein [Anaeromyxobacter sp.]
MIRAIATLVCCLGAVQVLAGEPADVPPPAWREARWGMAPAEVLAAFPGEARSPLKPNWADDGPVLAEIPSFEIGDGSYKVYFVFTKEKLARILVAARSLAEPEAVGRYDFLLKMLSGRYGAPEACSTDDKSKGVIRNVQVHCNWSAPSSKVTLAQSLIAPKQHLALGIATRPFSLTIFYSPPEPMKPLAP